MKNHLNQWLTDAGLELTSLQMTLVILTSIVLISLVIHWFFHKVVIKKIAKFARKSRRGWLVLIEDKFLSRLALTTQGVLFFVQVALWVNHKSIFYHAIQTLTVIWITVFAALTLFSLVDAFGYMTRKNKRTKNLPIQGLLQAIKLFISIITVIVIVATIVDRSPMLIISGLGAMTAVMMLVFKDPIMGLVAGIQLSANNMLRIGDWLEMPSYGADGDVIEIALTTVKVQNWDKTITTIPTYALIADSFKNWEGMSASGGRRIKRAIYIDVTSVKFMDQDLIERLQAANLLAPYLSQKTKELNEFNNQNNIDMASVVNGRRLTNIGTLRAYLVNYLKSHPKIHQEMTLMVRQLQASNMGIPLEIYAFTNTTVWAEYEQIQSDIFDHIYAVISAFDLRIHQSPGSADFSKLGKKCGEPC